MNVRRLWAAVRQWYATHSARDRRILLGVAVAAGLSLVYVAIVDPLIAYRRAVAEEITDGQEELERSARFLAAADSLRAERQQLQQRLEEAKTRLLPGDSGTLGAAALQERANAIAASKGITVQSVQVMREETVEPFRKVAIRLTLSGELKPFAEFLAGLEYGPQQLTIPVAEVSRRGAVAGAKGPRTLTATVELGGYLQPGAGTKKPEVEGGGGEPEVAAVEAEGGAPAEGEGAEPGAEGGVGAPKALLPLGADLPMFELPQLSPGPPVAAGVEAKAEPLPLAPPPPAGAPGAEAKPLPTPPPVPPPAGAPGDVAEPLPTPPPVPAPKSD